MAINTLNTHLVSEVRAIGKVLGITDAHKLSNLEFIDVITVLSKQCIEEGSSESTEVDTPAAERTGERVRTLKTEPVAVTTRAAVEDVSSKVEGSLPAENLSDFTVSSDKESSAAGKTEAPSAVLPTDFDNVIVNEGVLEKIGRAHV